MNQPLTIVAEISHTWSNGQPMDSKLISQKFEEVIEVNRERGYQLHSFSLSSAAPSESDLIETIVAVFELKQ